MTEFLQSAILSYESAFYLWKLGLNDTEKPDSCTGPKMVLPGHNLLLY